MRRARTEPISDILKMFVKAYGLEQSLGCARIINHWEDAVGSLIASYTTDLNIYNRKLYVSLKSSVVRNELMMMKTDLIKRLNEIAEIKAIDDIIFK